MTELIVETCPYCFVEFGVTSKQHLSLKKSLATFYCPSGHGMHFEKEIEEKKKLRIERDRIKKRGALTIIDGGAPASHQESE